MFTKIKQFVIKNQLLLSLLFLTVVIITIFVLNYLSGQNITTTQTTVSLTPSPTQVNIPTPTSVLENPSVINPNQSIKINWDGHNIDKYHEITLYQVTSKLVSPDIIKSIASTMGFKDSDQVSTLKPDNYRWTTSQGTLFASPQQDQIFFESYRLPSSTASKLSDDQVFKDITGHLDSLFGNDIAKIFTPSSPIHYFKYTFGTSAEEQVVSASKEDATVYEMSFRQSIGGAPVVALSGSADIITIGIDRENNINHFSIYSGIDTYKTSGTAISITTQELRQNAPLNARRIVAVGNISLDQQYTQAQELDLTVSAVEPAYLQENNSLFPVYLLHVTMSSGKLTPVQTIFSVPAIH